MIPSELLVQLGEIELNAEHPTERLRVANTGIAHSHILKAVLAYYRRGDEIKKPVRKPEIVENTTTHPVHRLQASLY